mgnify:CR=1 FL=1
MIIKSSSFLIEIKTINTNNNKANNTYNILFLIYRFFNNTIIFSCNNKYLVSTFFNIFKELSEEQKLSLLVVTHDKDFADKTDRIIEMGDGMII